MGFITFSDSALVPAGKSFLIAAIKDWGSYLPISVMESTPLGSGRMGGFNVVWEGRFMAAL